MNGAPHARRAPARTRIAAVFGLVFALLGGILLTLVFLLSRAGTAAKAHQLIGQQLTAVPEGTTPSDAPGQVTLQLAQIAADQVLTWSAVALLIMVVLAIAVGWWTAGRVLRPVHAMTSTARRISQENLHERIALQGPPDELKELADTFDALLARLERSFDSQRRFIANASHELRTPLTAQRAALQIGLDNPTPEELADVRESLLADNRRNERLIDGLLVLAQSEQALVETETVDLSAVAEEEAARCGQAAEAVGVTLSVETEPVLLRGDRILLSRLISNLLRNAIAYNHPGGRVHLRVSPCCLRVTNTGPAVPADEIDALFEPFRRGRGKDRTTMGPDRGHGLGLAIVRSITTAHGGTATAAPGAQGGLEVEVRFPRPA